MAEKSIFVPSDDFSSEDEILHEDTSELWNRSESENVYVENICESSSKKETLEEYLIQLKKSNYLLFQCLEQVGDSICAIDKSGNVIIWNKEAEKLYNLKKEEIVGKPLRDFFPNAGDLKTLENKEVFDNQYHIPRKGTEIVITTSPIYKNGKQIAVVSVERDVSKTIGLSEELKKAKKKIKMLNQKIESLEHKKQPLFLGKDSKMQKNVAQSIAFAKTDVPMLIFGESGTGKEVFAKLIHEKSQVTGNFVPVNCSAIPDSLFESEFFGYVRGAFTGAESKGKMGYFELAKNGTLFLDEIGDLPLNQQSKLLRAIQEGKINPLGSEKERALKVRLICATNKNLEDLIQKEQFREDLYYRINGVKITIPPIREREQDLEEMIDYFFKESCKKYNEDVKKISGDAMAILLAYQWPGNIRELKNTLRNMVILANSKEISAENISREIYYTVIGDTECSEESIKKYDCLKQQTENYERYLIRKALKETENQVTLAAKQLNVPRTTLIYRMKKLGIENGISPS